MNRVIDDRYELIEKIGEGGMATVYKARCRVLNRFVAIKVLKPAYIEDKKFLEGFSNESRAAASLIHPNIVGIYDVGVTEKNLHYIVMEYVEGKTLSSIIQQRDRLSEDETISIGQQIASALACAHRNNIIHRDVKPHNILVNESGVAKITDFGIAKATSATTIVNDNNITGSVHYFSPEQARGGYVDGKSDIYSLGIVMYEMITGRVPFDGDNPVSVAMMHINKEINPPSYYNPDISPALERVIMKATQKIPVHRFSDAEELLTVLNGISTSKKYLASGSIAGLPFDRKIVDMEQADDPSLDPEGKKSDTIVLLRDMNTGELAEEIKTNMNSMTGDSFSSMDDGDYSDRHEPLTGLEDGPGGSMIEDCTERVPAQVEAGDMGIIMAPGVDLSTNAGRRKSERVRRRDVAGASFDVPEPEPDPEPEEEPEVDLAGSEESPIWQIKSGDRALKKDKDGNWTTTKPKKRIFTVPRVLGVIFGIIISIFLSLGILWLLDYIRLPDVEMPKLLGMNYMDAKDLLDGYGLEMEVEDWVYSDEYEENEVCIQDPAEGEEVKEGCVVKVSVSKGLVENAVPNLESMDLESAKNLIEQCGYSLGTVTYEDSELAEGTVLRQSPASGELIQPGSAIDLIVSNGQAQVEITMVNLVGSTLDGATELLKNLNLILSNVEEKYSTTYSKGVVMEQSVPMGSKIMTGTGITVVISKGPDPDKEKTEAERTVPLVLDYSRASSEAFQLKVVMVKNGVVSTVYDGCCYKSNDGESISLTGSGKAQLRVYFDGTIVSEGTMDFDTGQYTD